MVLTGRIIWLLASTGKDGVSDLKDTVQAGDAAAHVVNVAPKEGLEWEEMAEHLLLLQVGCVCFSGCKEYQSAAAFAADSGSHCVPAESIYAFNEGEAAQLTLAQQSCHRKMCLMQLQVTSERHLAGRCSQCRP